MTYFFARNSGSSYPPLGEVVARGWISAQESAPSAVKFRGMRLSLKPLVGVLLLSLAVPAAASAQPAAPRVVVAVIDSAPNPYHEFFHAGGPLYGAGAPSSVTPEVLAEFGIDAAHTIHVTRTGDFEADFAADRAQFDAIRDGEPYWFAGTNVIGISIWPRRRRAAAARRRPAQPRHRHRRRGLAANPEAVVVMVETSGSDLLKFGTDPVGEHWAFTHPAVDIISTSYGPPGSPPLGYCAHRQLRRAS